MAGSPGQAVLFTTAGQLLGELASLDSDSALRYRLRRYAAPSLLAVDEVGYLPAEVLTIRIALTGIFLYIHYAA